MEYQMFLKGASARAKDDGIVVMRLVLKRECGPDMATEIMAEAGAMLDKPVAVSIKEAQIALPLGTTE